MNLLTEHTRRVFLSAPLLAAWLSRQRGDASGGTDIYLTDLGRCEPASALSKAQRKGCWKTIPYQTAEGWNGTMIAAGPYSQAADLTLRLGRAGWHAIYLGLHGFHDQQALARAGSGNSEIATLRVKLSRDRQFRMMRPENPDFTAISEVFWRIADLTGQDLFIAQAKGGIPLPAGLAYVKLVPLAPEQLAYQDQFRPTPQTRRLIAMEDGHSSTFYTYGSTTVDSIREHVEPYGGTDFGKLFYAVGSLGPGAGCYFGRTATYGPDEPILFGDDAKHEDFDDAGEQVTARSLREWRRQGLDPLKVTVDCAHEIGLEVHLCMRMGTVATPSAPRLPMVNFFRDHPEWRCRDREGNAVTRMSWAYPEVRRWQIAQFVELAGYGVEGLGLTFNRRPPFVLYEERTVEEFRARYGEDLRRLDPLRDPRVLDHWTGYVNTFMRELRAALNPIRRPNGRKLEITAYLDWQPENRRVGAMDVETWTKERLVDGLIIECDGELPDYAYFMALSRETSCKIYEGVNPLRMSPQDYVARAGRAFAAGLHGLAFWDMDGRLLFQSQWHAIRRLGHREMFPSMAAEPPAMQLVPLKTLDGIATNKTSFHESFIYH